MNLTLLEKLCNAGGISGDESEVRDIIIDEIKAVADDVKVDNLGNIIAFKKGKKRFGTKLMLSAHMDEVGFIVNYITDEGFLKISAVGGINAGTILGKSVYVGKRKIPGVIGVKPVHLLSEKERSKAIKMEDIYVDIGANSKADALNYVNLGDRVTFDSEYRKLDNGKIIGKALDDRAGCFILLNIMKKELPYDVYFTFVVQEEVGLRGAKAAAFFINPDSAIVVESTTAADVLGVPENERVCELGSGPVISFMDKSTIYCKEYFNLALKLGKERNIRTQVKRAVAGGNDSGAIHTSRGGVKTLAVSLPCRYLHTAAGMITVQDIEESEKLIYNLIENIAGGTL